VRLSVPGNILLLGEYAVLEEGGLGLAVAVDRRVRFSLEPAAGLTVRGTWPGGSFQWTRDDPSGSMLVSTVVAAVDSALGGMPVDGVLIEIDSSALFDSSGRKTGLGSSAATAAGLTAALLSAAGEKPVRRGGPEIALRAHREAQGGRGSGYDVMCSWHGGAGIFSGGAVPTWTPSALPAGFRIVLFPGPGPVLTPEAVRLYTAWKQANPEPARLFLEESNRRVKDFAAAASVPEAAARWGACRDLGMELGDAIGVPARIPVPLGLDPAQCKAIGAGSELGAALLPADTVTPFDSIEIAPEGVRWAE
jgi:phosphomevalonate kinase